MKKRVGFNPVDCGEECDAFSDTRDALSCNGSFSLKSGVTCLNSSSCFRDPISQFSEDLQMVEYMMGRFLPASEAMASVSAQRSWKKPPRGPVVDNSFERKTVQRKRLPLHYQYNISVAALNDKGGRIEEEHDEEEEESNEVVGYESTYYFSFKARGLISRFGLKRSLCLLNLVPGMKVQDLPRTKLCLMSSPRVKISNGETIVEGASWEAVYRHRLRNVDNIQKDIDSKLTTEVNQLTYWIDSQTPDGSSSFLHFSVAALSPNKIVDVKSKSKGSNDRILDSGKEDIGSYWEMASSIGRLRRFDSRSPATDRIQINSSQLPDTSNSNSRLVSLTACTKENTDSGYTLLSEFQRTEESVVTETSGGCQSQSKFPRVAEPGFSSYSKTLNCEDKKANDFKNSLRGRRFPNPWHCLCFPLHCQILLLILGFSEHCLVYQQKVHIKRKF